MLEAAQPGIHILNVATVARPQLGDHLTAAFGLVRCAPLVFLRIRAWRQGGKSSPPTAGITLAERHGTAKVVGVPTRSSRRAPMISDTLLRPAVYCVLFLGFLSLLIGRAFIRRRNFAQAAETLWFVTLALLLCFGLIFYAQNDSIDTLRIQV